MADVTISALPAATTIAIGSDVLPIDTTIAATPTTGKTTPNQLVNAVLAAPAAIGSTIPAAGTFTTAAAGAYQMTSSAIITDASTARTLSAGDNGKVVYFTNGAAITVTTAAGLGAGFSVTIIQGGAGQITVAQGASTTLVSYGTLVKSAGQYGMLSIINPVADTFVLGGNLGA